MVSPFHVESSPFLALLRLFKTFIIFSEDQMFVSQFFGVDFAVSVPFSYALLSTSLGFGLFSGFL